MTLKSKLTVFFIIVLSLGVSALARHRLETLAPDRDRFMELMYVPKGKALKVMACGFDAPLADILWTRGLIYYSQNVRANNKSAKAGKYRYVYQLHDVITNLTPRFTRAYLYGALFLFSTGKEQNLYQGIKLLEKGLSAYDQAEKEGDPILPDARWMLHVHIANTYEAQLQVMHKEKGDFAAARDDLASAREHFRQAAATPGCPKEIIASWAGFENQLLLGKGLLERYDVMIDVWEKMLAQKQSNEELTSFARERLAELRHKREQLRATRETETILPSAVQAYLKDHACLPQSVPELVEKKYLAELPSLPLNEDNDFGNMQDQPVIFPDGEVRSLALAKTEARFMLDLIFEAVRDYRNRTGKFPESLQALEQAKILQQIPEHPLSKAGFYFKYDPQSGLTTEAQAELVK